MSQSINQSLNQDIKLSIIQVAIAMNKFWFSNAHRVLLIKCTSPLQVFLHDAAEIPMMNDVGFRVSVGRSTSVSFTLKNVRICNKYRGV